MTVALAEETYLPEQDEGVAEVHSFLTAHETRRGGAPEPRYLLVGADEHDQVELPPSLYRILRQVVEALQSGVAVTVAPRSMTLTTQQAADVLGVSRPTVVRLITSGDLPAERPGTRHRLRLHDVLEYRDRRRRRQYEVLAATADQFDDQDPEAVLAELREVRKAAGAKRRAITSGDEQG